MRSKRRPLTYNTLGKVLIEKGDAKGAIESHKRALDIAESLLAEDPTNGEHKRDAEFALEFLGYAQFEAKDYNSALLNFRKVLSMHGENSSGNKGDSISPVYAGMAKTLAAKNELKESVENYYRVIPIAEESAKQSPMNMRKVSRLAVYYLEGEKVLAKFAGGLRGEERDKTYRNACEWLQKSAVIFDEMKRSRKLSRLNEKYLDEVRNELSKCQQNLPK